MPVSTKPLRKFSSLTFNFKTCQCIQSSFKSCFVFLRCWVAVGEFQSSPWPHESTVPCPTLLGSPERWLKFKGIYNLQSTLGSCWKKDTLINNILFFPPDHFINVGNCLFYFYYNLNSNSLFLHLNNMISPHPKEFAIQLIHGLREETKGQCGIVN